MTVRQDIRDRVIADLNAAPPTGVPMTTKRRYMPGEKINTARMAAFFAEEEASRPGGAAGPITRRVLTLALQAVVCVEDPAQADDAIEPLLAHIVDMMGDTNLGGLATNVAEVSTLWASDNQSGVFILMALTRWRIEYQTKRDDLTRKQ